MAIQNLANTITADPAAFGTWDTYKSHNAPFLVEEYYIVTQKTNDYETRIAVLDEDQLPIVTAVVDVYDDIEEAKRQLAFVASISDHFRHRITDAQLVALLSSYDLFVSNATFPNGREDFHDLRLVKNLIWAIDHGRMPEDYFAVPTPRRKRVPTDYSQHPFRATATKIAEAFIAA